MCYIDGKNLACKFIKKFILLPCSTEENVFSEVYTIHIFDTASLWTYKPGMYIAASAVTDTYTHKTITVHAPRVKNKNKN